MATISLKKTKTTSVDNRSICKNCKNWKSKQSELDYSTFYGICTSHKWKFVTTESADIRILDRNNRSKKHMGVHTFENQNAVVPIGDVERSQYCFVTNENFGCVHFNCH